MMFIKRKTKAEIKDLIPLSYRMFFSVVIMIDVFSIVVSSISGFYFYLYLPYVWACVVLGFLIWMIVYGCFNYVLTGWLQKLVDDERVG